MNKTASNRIKPEIASTAADWFTRLQEDDAAEQDFQEWQRWLASSKENQQAFHEIEQAWRLIGNVNPILWAEAGELANELRPLDLNAPTSNKQITYRRFHWAIAATVLLTMAIVFGFYQPNAPYAAYVTQTAEQRSFLLADGSRITLGAQSKVTPHFKSDSRRIVLDYGEAYFEVAHDANRPFTVAAGSSEIRAVGTAFNVRTTSDRVLVSVTEGRVEIIPNEQAMQTPGTTAPPPASQILVSAGEQAAITHLGTQKNATPATSAVTWLQGRFEYRGEELQHVVDDLNRYTDRHIVLTDPSLRTLRYSGTVFPDHVDEWLQGISGVLPVMVRDAGQQREISAIP